MPEGKSKILCYALAGSAQTEGGWNMRKIREVKSLKILLVAVLLLGLCGCATIGREFAVGAVAQIKIGVTTSDEIRTLFGEPWRTGIEDGNKTWTYGHYHYSAFSPAQTRDLVVRFGPQGKIVRSYSFNSTYEEDQGR
jgi:hypothetical protein